jgi:hypothetical protein
MSERKSQEVKKKEVKITAKFDCVQGTCDRYTIGALGDDISGALYVKKSSVLPKEIKILFKEGSET